MRAELAIALAAIVVLTLLVAFVALLSQSRSVDAVDQLLSVDGRMAELSLRSNVAMLKARRAEKDFLLFRNDFGFLEARSRYATLLRTSVGELRQHMAEVRTLTGAPEIVEQTKAIERAVVEYESGFLETVQSYGELGRVGTGIEGRMRAKAHEIELLLRTRGQDGLMADLLSLRRHEKDFLMRGQARYVQQFEQTIEQFKARVTAARLPAELGSRLARLADEYAEQFGQHVRVCERIDEQKRVYLRAAHAIEPVLDQLYRSANRSANSRRIGVEAAARTTTAVIIAAGLIAALLGLVVGWVVWRNITRSVDQCLIFAQRIARGQLTARLALRGQREFTTLATALNGMAQGLQESRASLEARAEELATSNRALHEEIAERRRAEAELGRIGRARQVMADCNRVLVHASSESKLLDDMCRTVVERGNYRMAWVGVAQHDEAKTVLPVAHAGFEQGYLDLFRLSWADDEPSRCGLAGAVIRNARPAVVRNIDVDPGFVTWRDETLARGYASALCLPLRDASGEAFAAISIYASEPNAFDVQEQGMLGELADDLAYGIGSLRSAVARRQAEEALRLRHRAVESSVNAVVITDYTRPGNPIEYVNPAFERITGYSAPEVVGRCGSFLLGDESEQPGALELDRALREQREGHAVLRHYRKDGSLFWNDLHYAPVRDDTGHVTHYVGIMSDISETKNYEMQLERQANYDSLTGLANRNLLRDRLEQMLAHANRHGQAAAVVFIDLDDFKFINDSLGHRAGDDALKLTASRLAACVRDSDTVARWGGDEFVVVVRLEPEGDHDAQTATLAITEIVQRILIEVSQPLVLGDAEFTLSCSAGLSVYPHDGADAENLLRNADSAMYRAKSLGRGRFHFYTEQMGAQVQERLELETALRRAVDREEFELHYQPKVDLRSGRISGVEALIRWRHPERGLVPPGLFIPLAEETDVIVPIGAWVLRAACAQAKAWSAAGFPELTVAVNLSARQFRHQDVPALVRRTLADTGLAASQLELELTESLLIQDDDTIARALHELKSIGVTLALDDFGTGYSSLSYLKRFPIDVVKIDRSFIGDVAGSVDDASLTRAIIAMARSLHMETIAEGVETAEQLAFLQANGCDAIQGYYFSRPLPANDLAALLSEGRHLPVKKSESELARLEA
jgi:diguanylate cyclase (GGDEF)-like protein/PAS domain S-box-containing protein